MAGRCSQGLDERARVAARQGEVGGLHPDEVELHLQLVGGVAAEEGTLLRVREVDLAQHHRPAGPSVEEGADRAHQLVRVDRAVRVPGVLRVLLEERDAVDTEAVEAELEPEPDDAQDLVHDSRVGQVEVRLVLVEVVEVPLAGAVVELPDRVLLVREDHELRRVRRLGVTPHVVVPVAVGRAATRRLEPGVPVGGVVDDEVGDHVDPAVVGGADDLDQLPEVAQPRVHAVEVRDVVAVVPVRARVERHQPQAGDAELGEVVDALGQAPQVADAVAVGVVEGLDVQAVDDGALPPQVARVADSHAATQADSRAVRQPLRAGSTSAPKVSMNPCCSCPTKCR